MTGENTTVQKNSSTDLVSDCKAADGSGSMLINNKGDLGLLVCRPGVRDVLLVFKGQGVMIRDL